MRNATKTAEDRIAQRSLAAALVFAKSCAEDGSPRWEMCMQHMSADEYCRLAKAHRTHASDCATNNEPYMPNGPCDCDDPEKVALRKALDSAVRYMRDAGAFLEDFPEITAAADAAGIKTGL